MVLLAQVGCQEVRVNFKDHLLENASEEDTAGALTVNAVPYVSYGYPPDMKYKLWYTVKVNTATGGCGDFTYYDYDVVPSRVIRWK